MRKKDLQHPGRRVLEACIKPHGLTVTEAAAAMNVARNTLSRLIHGHHGISPDMAVRLSLAFGGTPEMWLRLQTDYDLARARENVKVGDIKRVASTTELQKGIVRKSSIDEHLLEDDLRDTTPEERIAAVF